MAKTEVVAAEKADEGTITADEVIYDTVVDDQLSYGPYPEMVEVDTQHGRYAVPRGKKMTFGLYRRFDKKEGIWIQEYLPEYSDANIAPDDPFHDMTRPSVALKGKSAEENAENVRRYNEFDRARKAKRQAERIEKEKQLIEKIG